MAHIARERTRILGRIHRIQGQLRAIEQMVDEDRDCADTLQTIAACRGAMNGLMKEVLEGHIREHVLDPDEDLDEERKAALDELLSVIRVYLR
jgi:DNA-binding FrmR family transcriptional regulator